MKNKNAVLTMCVLDDIILQTKDFHLLAYDHYFSRMRLWRNSHVTVRYFRSSSISAKHRPSDSVLLSRLLLIPRRLVKREDVQTWQLTQGLTNGWAVWKHLCQADSCEWFLTYVSSSSGRRHILSRNQWEKYKDEKRKENSSSFDPTRQFFVINHLKHGYYLQLRFLLRRYRHPR